LHSRVADSLIGGLRTQIAGTADFLSECSAGDFEAYRESLEAYVFFAYWFITGAERKLPTSTSTMDKSKAGFSFYSRAK
jgi:hypothetical protein